MGQIEALQAGNLSLRKGEGAVERLFCNVHYKITALRQTSEHRHEIVETDTVHVPRHDRGQETVY